MTLVFDQQSAQAGTHALVIGIGQYPHLLGGDDALFPGHESMRQLSSPPVSARALADWLLTSYTNPDRPLQSVDVLISEQGNDRFGLPDGTQSTIDRATKNNVSQAILDWNTRGDSHDENMILLFFCGHGISAGPQATLLMEDFGSTPASPLNQAIDFNSLYQGMDKCSARFQCFFIDACRVASSTLIDTYGYSGDPVIAGVVRQTQPPRNAPAYYASAPGAPAYGRTNEPSFFTESLLKAFDGAGSDDLDGDWRIQTNVLNLGIEQLLKRLLKSTGGITQVIRTDNLARFALHHINGNPTVPVSVGCDPDAANADADLSYQGNGGNGARAQPDNKEWDIDLEPGNYDFNASFPGGQFNNAQKSDFVRPPYRPVSIKV
jgi:hypothetical protein